MPAEPGETIGHYRVLEKIGEGGMGVVYLAEDERLDRKVALKVLSAELSGDPGWLERFKREARTLATLNHPNIVTIYSVEQAQETHYFTMEFVEGKTLGALIPKGGLTVPRFLDLAVSIGDALAAAHEQGITHGDLKPANIMVGSTGVSILDFGLARQGHGEIDTDVSDVSTFPHKLADSGQLIGTVPYMSPEQVQAKSIDPRADIFSLGIIFYQMVTGDLPFKGETPAELMSSILRDTPVSATDLKIGVPGHLGRILRRCLEKDPKRRYQVARDLLNDLAELKREIESGAAVAFQTSIAVLPFADMSPEKDQEYFCDGIAEELITVLSTIRDLRVVARTSSFAFRGKELDIREVGDALNVATVVEGSVRKAGQRLRISAQLVNVDSGYHIWSESYDREMDDVFLVQEEIAREVADKLKIKLVGAGAEPRVRRHTKDLEAYNLYLQGRFHWNRRTEDGFRKGIEYFQGAVQKDPEYAPAFAGLADCYTQLGDYGYLPPNEARSDAKAAARRALEIDDSLGEAHASLAYLTMLYDWDWPAAELEFKRAIDLNPSYATGHQLCAEYLTAMGRMDEAITEIRRARELDPLSLIVNTIVGWVYYRARRFKQARVHCQKALELDKRFAVAHHLLGWIYGKQGKHEEAIEEARRSVSLSRQSTLMTASLGYALGMAGDRDGARQILGELVERARQDYVSPYDLALVYTGLGDREKALACLQRACVERYGWLVYLNADPVWDPLREDSRFASLVNRIGLPD